MKKKSSHHLLTFMFMVKEIARWQNRTWIDVVGSFEWWICWFLWIKGCFHLEYFRPSNPLISKAEEHAGLALIVDCFPSYAWKTFTQTTCSGTDARWACWRNFRYFHGLYDQSLLWFVCFHVNWGQNSDRRRPERVVSEIRLDPGVTADLDPPVQIR